MIREKYGVLNLFQFLVLFVFVLLAIMLMLIGSQVYNNTIETMDNNATLRTAAGYLTNREREFGSRAFVDGDMLLFTLYIEGDQYLYRIYEHEGYLMESLLPLSYEFERGDGEMITTIDIFHPVARAGGIEIRFSYEGNEIVKCIRGGDDEKL